VNELLWIAFALFLVFEGLLPAINPSLYRQMVQMISERDDKSLRTIGVIMMALGAVIIFIIKS